MTGRCSLPGSVTCTDPLGLGCGGCPGLYSYAEAVPGGTCWLGLCNACHPQVGVLAPSLLLQASLD
jgi:hypothetical protein